jgi:hypothetical protein
MGLHGVQVVGGSNPPCPTNHNPTKPPSSRGRHRPPRVDRQPFRFPDALFGYAARKGKVIDLELACIRATFAQCGKLAAAGARIFINIHPAVIGTGGLEATLERCVASSGVRAEQIVLEITEQQPLAGIDAVARECAALRSRGFSFALDDVGIAYSHLTHIDAIIPACEDQSGIRQLLRNRRDADADRAKRAFARARIRLRAGPRRGGDRRHARRCSPRRDSLRTGLLLRPPGAGGVLYVTGDAWQSGCSG